ncbi:hypothetical protein LEP1GSC050_3578 [Leptospira broomii serovar Hurstbridge str. 5399]|uniref:Uncharacterized protein n=1 Tax=Leptospira broomii serovar Hurstbridge str. 5399 TaxID=1049789 RepID=T0FCI6_9LEPT|nr:hypothetical protein [Leptospira broomii]EQA45322.1 hypothetical protein LEP1GSC050_3578 [Leptospira broomii serovar Hurstbridge str. 5399]
MQNIDYSRRLKQTGIRGGTANRPLDSQPTVQTIQHVRGSASPIRSFPSSRSLFLILVGAISLFTAGVVVGLRLDQKEQAFAQNETQSFYNTGKFSRRNPAETIEQRENSGQAEVKSESSEKPESKDFGHAEEKPSSENKGLKFPARSDRENYFISIPTSDSLEAMEVGKKLLRAKPEFQGRIFRSGHGELFIGYFYGKAEATQALESIRPLNDPIFHGSQIHKTKR